MHFSIRHCRTLEATLSIEVLMGAITYLYLRYRSDVECTLSAHWTGWYGLCQVGQADTFALWGSS
jgi:hypothetical protein